jgi:autotransporter translocation and assembly factor TamB
VSEETKSAKPKSRFRKWLLRLLAAAVLLLIGLVIFHRPLILALIRWAGPQGAATQGLPLTWTVNGSLWDDLEITDLTTGGGDAHWLPKATLGKLALSYDPRAELEHIVKGVTIHDLAAEVDLRKLPASEPDAELPTKKQPTGKAPPLVWPRFIDLKNIQAHVILADGKKLVLEGLTLQVGEGMSGIFQCRTLRMEPDGLSLENLKAQVDWQPRLLVIKNFALPKDVVLDELRLDLKDFESGTLVTHILAHLGAAKVAVDATVADAFGSKLTVKADTDISDLRAAELHDLGLPKEVLFDKGSLHLLAEGDPLTPPLLKVQTQLALSNIRAAGAKIDQVELRADIADSIAKVTALRVISGSNLIETTAQAQLPQKIEDWQTTTWTAVTKASIQDLKQLLDNPPPASGNITLEAKANGVGATPTEVTGTLNGETLAFQEYRLPKLGSQFSLNGKQARFEIPGLELGTGNQLSLKATLLIDDAMPVQAEWKLGLSEPMELFKTTGLKAPEKPVSAIIDFTGKADLKVKDLSAGHYEGILADLSLQVQKGRFGDSQLPSIALEAHTQNGQAHIKPCSIRFDEENHLELTADVAMKPPYAFTTQGGITMPALIKLNTLLASLSAPEMKSGSLFSSLNATGQLHPWQCEGKATLTASQVHPATLPEPADLTLDASFAGTRADIKAIEAKLGLWKLALKGVVDDKSAQLSQLQVWQKDTLLMEGHASAPFDIMQASQPSSAPVDVVIKAKDLRLNEVLAAAGVKDIPPGILNADIAIQGRLETLDGVVKVNLRDVKVPNGPKAFTPATLDLDTTLRGDQLKSLIKLSQPPLQPLTVDAAMPLDVDALVKKPALLNDTPLKVAVRMAESDLGFLREYAPDMIQSLPAKLKLNADVTGTVAKPLIQAALDLDAKEVSWAKADMPSVRDVRVRLRVNDRKLNIEDLSLLMAGGRVKLGGIVDAADTKNPALNLNIMAREALVFRDPTTSLRANADITCIGTLAAARVAGQVEAVRGRVFKEIDLMPVLKLPADVPPVPENTQRSEAKLALPPALKDWTFDLRVKTRDPLLISGNLVNGAISADVLLGGSGASPQLTGGANIDRLLLKLPFSLVKITKGVVTLKPQTPFDPSLDIRGESRIGNNDITLYVYGDSTNPKTRFVSSPPMSEPDIVTLLATGTTLNGSASDLASEAASRAALLFISELYRKTFNKKKVVREEPPRLHMSVNPSGGDRSADAVQAMYDLTEKWRITGRFTQAGRMKALLGYVLRFGQAAKAVDEKK